MNSLGFMVIASAFVCFGLVSGKLRNSILTPPMVFTSFGLVIGPSILGLENLDLGHHFIHALAEITLVLVLFTDASRIDLKLLRRDHDLPVWLLAIGLPFTILLGTGVGMIIFPNFSIWEAALLAAILAPTDAALGQAVVSNPLVPVRMRQTLNVESGLNDGIALPMVLLFASFASAAHSNSGVWHWLQFGALQVTLGPLTGVVIGFIGAKCIESTSLRGWMIESFEGLSALGIAIISFAVSEMIGGNGFISAFVSGLVFGNTVKTKCTFLFEFAESEGQFLTLLTFLFFGASMVPLVKGHLNISIFLYALLSLTLIRMIPVALSLLGTKLRRPSVLFLGWFGPRGLASILFALLILEEAEIASKEVLTVITIVAVTLSILAHGLTAAPAARWYATQVTRMGECEEIKPVSEMPSKV